MMCDSPRRRKLPRELFETRSHAWHSLGLGDELLPRTPREASPGCWSRSLVLAATLFVYGTAPRAAARARRVGADRAPSRSSSSSARRRPTGSARPSPPRLYRRLDPATAGTLGFLFRLAAMAAVVILALRIAGVNAAALAVGGAFTAIVLGLAAQQTLAGIFAGILLQSTRPFRVGERVRLVGGALAGSLEGTVSSLGLFYTTLVQGADRLLVPNSVLDQPRRRPAARAREGRPPGPLPVRRQPEADRGQPARGDLGPDPLPAERLARGARRARAPCSGSRRRRCAPKTARSSPRRCSRRSGATAPARPARPARRRSSPIAARGTVSGSPPVQALKRYQDGFASRSLVSRPAESQNWQAPSSRARRTTRRRRSARCGGWRRSIDIASLQLTRLALEAALPARLEAVGSPAELGHVERRRGRRGGPSSPAAG